MLRQVGSFIAVGIAMLIGTWAAAVVAAEPAVAAGPHAAVVAVVSPASNTLAERLAAKEIRRYVYLRTGTLLPIVDDLGKTPRGGLILVGCKDRPGVGPLLARAGLKDRADALAAEQYLLKTVEHDGRSIAMVVGGDPIGTLYGAYRLAEHLGVRFYMHGDVVPDAPTTLAMPQLDETGKPLFDRRGIQPFHDFPEGPDWWSADGYKAIVGQLPKMRMNFFGLHTYPEGGVGPEPAVWIGQGDDLQSDGRVKASYPSRHFTTGNVTGAWGYRPMKTSDYTFGAAAIYARDDYGPPYMDGLGTWTQMSPEQSNELFDRFGRVLGDVFTFARSVGVKTCLGTETPLVIPKPVRERLKAAGKDPADPAVVQEVYEAMFRRIMRVHPLDYYWFWTPEGWTWEEVKQQQVDATLADFRAAIAAAKKVDAPFTLATCGWVLGPQQDRALFDNMLPKEMPMSCINRQVGQSPVEAGFAEVAGRPKWAIPWMEDDPAMILPQLWAGRMRMDAADSLRYGCTGLLGIHWRTRILGPNVSALAKAAWDQTGWNPALDPAAKQAAPRLPEGPDGGRSAAFPGASVASTDDDTLYQTVRYDVAAYRLDVPNGKYTVTLQFCEPHYDANHKRVFGVNLQGKQAIDTLDVFREVGKNRALDRTFRDVEVTDGQLVVDFLPQLEFPCIAALTVEGPAVRKINCGGPAYKDYQADWPASQSSGRQRFLPVDDFYADWSLSEFGPEAAAEIAAIFTRIDGHLPRPSTWVDGPGGINPDSRPWAEARQEYAFVDELAALGPRVKGAGNLERFDYWLNNFRYLRAVGHTNCIWARFNQAMTQVKAEQNAEAQRRLAREVALPIRKELMAEVARLHAYLLATATTPGAMGNVTNWQQHLAPSLWIAPGEELAKILGEPLPADAMPSPDYAGPPRLFVPVVRTSLVAGETLSLDVVILGEKPRDAAVYWRPLGAGTFTKVPLGHIARGVYRAELSADATAGDFEYYVEATADGGAALRFPATAPALNQSVIVLTDR